MESRSSRRLGLAWRLAAATLVCAACSPRQTGSAPTPDSRFPAAPRSEARPIARPDIIVIMADDLDVQLGSLAAMPKLATLLTRQGLSLDRHYVSFPTCCPARVSFLRGQYPHSHRILTNAPPAGGYEKVLPLGLEDSTLGTWLQEAGYETVYAGKYLNGYPMPADPQRVPPGWSQWYSPVDEAAYGSFGYRMNENGALVAYGQEASDHVTDVLAGKVGAAIRDAAANERPLFAVVAPFAPHAPAVPAPRHAGLFADAKAPRSGSFDEADVSDKPVRIQLLPPLYPEAVATMDADHRSRLQSLQAVDDLLAELLRALDETGRLEQSFVFFTSDNGYHLGQHRLPAGKTTAYEEDIRVPMIIRGPGIAAGRREDRWLTGMVDLAPTIAELAGVKAPDFVEGRSLAALLRSEGPPPSDWRRAFLLEGYAGGSRSQRGTPVTSPEADRPGFGAVAPADAFDLTRADADMPDQENPNPTREVYIGLRTPRLTFVQTLPAEFEVYDNASDPAQLRNLAGLLSPDSMKSLAAWAMALHLCKGADCRLLEARPLPTLPVALLPPPPSPAPTGQAIATPIHEPTKTSTTASPVPGDQPTVTASPSSVGSASSVPADSLPKRLLPLLLRRGRG